MKIKVLLFFAVFTTNAVVASSFSIETEKLLKRLQELEKGTFTKTSRNEHITTESASNEEFEQPIRTVPDLHQGNEQNTSATKGVRRRKLINQTRGLAPRRGSLETVDLSDDTAVNSPRRDSGYSAKNSSGSDSDCEKTLDKLLKEDFEPLPPVKKISQGRDQNTTGGSPLIVAGYSSKDSSGSESDCDNRFDKLNVLGTVSTSSDSDWDDEDEHKNVSQMPHFIVNPTYLNMPGLDFRELANLETAESHAQHAENITAQQEQIEDVDLSGIRPLKTLCAWDDKLCFKDRLNRRIILTVDGLREKHQIKNKTCNDVEAAAHYLISADDSLGSKIYTLLAMSNAQKNPYYEKVCASLLSQFCWSHQEYADELIRSLVEIPEKINLQGISGKSVLMLLSSVGNDKVRTTESSSSALSYIESHNVLGRIRACQKLLKAGAAVHLEDAEGYTALYRAVMTLNAPLTKLLLRNKEVFTYETMRTAFNLLLSLTAGTTKISDVEELESQSSREESFQREKIFRAFIRAGISIDQADKQGNTLCHRAAYKGDAKMVRLFIDKGGNINLRNNMGQTAQHFACLKNRATIIVLLLKNMARMTIFDLYGNLPVHYACMGGYNFAEIHHMSNGMEVLRFNYHKNSQQPPLNVDEENHSKWKPLHWACYFGNSRAVAFLLEDPKVDLHSMTGYSLKTPLMLACEKGHIDVCRILLSHDTRSSVSQMEIRNEVGTALDWACEFEQVEICGMLLRHRSFNPSELEKVTVLRRACQTGNRRLQDLLLDSLGDWQRRGSGGNTVLHLACKKGYDDVVDLLVRNLGALRVGIELKNSDGQDPLQCARSHKRNTVVQLLEKLRH